MYRYYQIADAADPSVAELRAALAKAGATVQKIEKERCFMVALEPGAPKLTDEQEERLLWLLTETFEPEKTRARQSFLGRVKRGEWMVEVRFMLKALLLFFMSCRLSHGEQTGLIYCLVQAIVLVNSSARQRCSAQ
eukprot:6203097-Pleurochrysis_carterae.AAC.3